jgi:enoyl-CoA hydratase/carnithine racemase
MAFEYGLTLERELQKALFDSKDAKEGLNAYNTKRSPQFEGK